MRWTPIEDIQQRAPNEVVRIEPHEAPTPLMPINLIGSCDPVIVDYREP